MLHQLRPKLQPYKPYLKPSTALFNLNPNMQTWFFLSFGALVNHVSSLKSHNNDKFGLAVSQYSRIPTKAKPAFFGKSSINANLLFYEWRALCLILSAVSKKKAFTIPVVDKTLQPFASAISWATWQGSTTLWTLLNNKPLTKSFLANQECACYVILTNKIDRKSLRLRLLPSIGIITPFNTFQPWAGITTLHEDMLLQYFLLAWTWRFAK